MVSGGQTPQERREQIVALAKGDKGEPGERGQRGEQLSRPLRRALVWLFLLAVALSVTSILISVHYVQSTQAAQQQQGQLVERKLCTTLGRLAVLQPPAGDPASNPSRAYLQGLHSTLSELGPDLGCR